MEKKEVEFLKPGEQQKDKHGQKVSFLARIEEYTAMKHIISPRLSK